MANDHSVVLRGNVNSALAFLDGCGIGKGVPLFKGGPIEVSNMDGDRIEVYERFTLYYVKGGERVVVSYEYSDAEMHQWVQAAKAYAMGVPIFKPL